jgi:hypothetical protein
MKGWGGIGSGAGPYMGAAPVVGVNGHIDDGYPDGWGKV